MLNTCPIHRIVKNLQYLLVYGQNGDSSVSIVTGLWTGRSEARIPAGTRYFSLLQNVKGGSGAHPDFILMGAGVLLRGKVVGA
jgi:hypothetical protein